MENVNDDLLLEILTSGCDERVFIHETTNANKYHLNPLKFDKLLHRGSCTCGTLTADAYKVGLEFLKNYEDSKYESILKNQSQRLKAMLIDESIDFDVFYGPSGSDLMYLPLLFQYIIDPNKKIINIVSCPEELGSGSKAAAEGLYFSEWSQYGKPLPIGKNVSEKINSEVFYLPARNENGNIVDRNQAIRDLINKFPNELIIGNLVFGSKSGIKDDLAIIDEFKEGIMWVVDMCQFRTDRKLIYELISKGAMISITGSKFYQAPPFCGALLVPKYWSEKIKDKDASILETYNTLFTSYDYPLEFEKMRKNLPDFKNIGLRLRWEIALCEMESFLAFPQEKSNALIRRWNQVVIGRLAQSDLFRLMPDIELTNDSIISFMVIKNGVALDNKELKILFDYLVLNEHEGIENFTHVFLGQPVQYGEKSFIRLAIGSFSIRKQLMNNQFNPKSDIAFIQVIENAVKKLFP